MIAGKRQFMDALDGGQWRYGDESIPTVGVTYFAGTFVRHPLALAASKAVLLHMKEAGPKLQEDLTAKTAAMVAEINAYMVEIGAPFKLNTFSSLWRNVFTEDLPYADLIYAMIRDRGIHILDNFPCFLTTAHSDEDIAKIVRAYKEAASEMQASGFFPIRVTRTAPLETGVREAPSTEPQREVWLADKLGTEASLAYNESVSLHLRGELDVGALRQAVRELPQRHDALRATFSADGTAIRAASALELEVPLRDLSDLPAAEREQQLAAIVARHVGEPFALEQGPLIRAELVRLDPDHHVLVFTGHHIVLDGWSYWVIVKDLASLYGIATGARTQPLAPAPSFFDYAIDVAAKQTSAEVRANEAWWIERFAAGVPTLDLPTDRPRPAVRTTAAGREDFTLPADLLAASRSSARSSARVRSRRCSRVSMCCSTGSPVRPMSSSACRPRARPPPGSRASSVTRSTCCRCATSSSAPTRSSEHVAASRRTMLDAYDHQDVTFGRVLQMLPIARDPSRLPLITVIFNIDQALAVRGPRHAGHLARARIERADPRDVRAVHQRGGYRQRRSASSASTTRICSTPPPSGAGLPRSRCCCARRSPIRRRRSASYRSSPKKIAAQLAAWNRTEADYPRTTRVEELMFATARARARSHRGDRERQDADVPRARAARRGDRGRDPRDRRARRRSGRPVRRSRPRSRAVAVRRARRGRDLRAARSELPDRAPALHGRGREARRDRDDERDRASLRIGDRPRAGRHPRATHRRPTTARSIIFPL